MIPRFATFLALLLLLPFSALAQLDALETEDLRLVYIEGAQSYLVPHVARCFQNSMAFQRRLFDYEPSEKVTVILSDFADYGNAGAGAVPRNGLAVSIAPMSFAYETYPANERINTLMNHELVHIVNFDQATGSDLFFRGLFRGKVDESATHPETVLYGYLTAPRSSAPRWFHEGIAVFTETRMAGGLGRGVGSYDEMVFRSMVRDGSRFYDPLGLVSEGTKVDFQLEMNSYLYGTRFFSYLALHYGPQSLVEWVDRDPGSSAYYAHQFEKVYGRSLDEGWQEWVDWEQAFQQENLRRIREFPTTPYRDISDRPLGSISRAFYDPETRRIYAALNYPGVVSHVAAISVDDGRVERLRDVKDPMMYSVTSLAYDPQARTLFYTRDNSAWRDVVALELESGRSQRLLEDQRIGELVFDPSDRALWGVRHFNGLCTLVRMPHPYEEWNQIHTFEMGQTFYDLDVSPDGRLLSGSLGEVNGRHRVVVLETSTLLEGRVAPQDEFDFGTTIPSNFVFTPDGGKLVGSSYYTGASNIFRYDLAADSLEALSNCETGFFRPIPVHEDSLIVFRYTGEGFVPTWIQAEPLEDVNAVILLGARIVEEHPSIQDWRVGSPARVPLDSMIQYRGPYRALRGQELESVYPIVEGYKDYPAYGLQAQFSDPISLHQTDLSMSWTPNEGLDDDERLHAQLRYRRYDWRLSARWNGADFYDLFGPTRTSRKGYSVSLGYGTTLLYDLPRELTLDLDVSRHGNLERLPDYQNVATSFEELWAGALRLGYRNLRFSLGAVDYEKGMTAGLVLSDNHVNGTSYPQAVGTLDLGAPLFAHSSAWLRAAAGAARGDRDEPFANFFFGGFGNNWVDHREPKRYRDWYAFPGLELNEVGGRSFVRAMLDWNLPPVRFRRLGTPALYASWARSSLFAAGLVTDPDSAALRQELLSLGGQIDLRLSMLAHLDLTASVGYAVALEEGRGPRRELMLSLKIL